jgi:beta-barrel assembly-enhancing protease
LPPAGAVYWRISTQGLEDKLETKIFVPLKFLVEQFPEFIPGHLRYAQALQSYERHEEALKILDQAVILYPDEPDLLYAKIEADNKAKKWLDASLAARRFSLFNPEHPQSPEFLELADKNLAKYQQDLQAQMTGNLIANIFTGALGFILTGNIFGPLSALETTMLLLQGETGIGEQIAGQVKNQLPILENEEVNQYVTEMGEKLVKVTGRNDFQYEFNIIMDDQLNAFALPGGKIFVNAGAILKTQSEAELAGLLAHELAHAVLSHGFQLVTQGNLTANVVGNIPYIGGLATNLIVLNYSRTMEEEADLFGTRILAASGYAADGVRNLMQILADDDKPSPPAWLSTHPNTRQRVTYLENFIISNGFNRYTYEGVSRHQEIRERVRVLWEEYQETDEYKERQLRERRY